MNEDQQISPFLYHNKYIKNEEKPQLETSEKGIYHKDYSKCALWQALKCKIMYNLCLFDTYGVESCPTLQKKS